MITKPTSSVQYFKHPVMFSRNRNLLHINQVDSFREWLLKRGYRSVDLGEYEVLRMIHPDAPPKDILIVWQRLDSKEHVTITGVSYVAYWAWRKETKPKSKFITKNPTQPKPLVKPKPTKNPTVIKKPAKQPKQKGD